jgi:L-asparagine oxygenase
MTVVGTVTLAEEISVRLAAVARELAAGGASAATALLDVEPTVLTEISRLLRHSLRPPDRQLGYLVAAALFDLPPLGPTPAHWSQVDDDEDGRSFDIAFVLAAAALGMPFGWSGQQNGRIVNNVLPSRADEHRQVGASSTAELRWHTEDAFRSDRSDLVLLACVRNPGNVGSRLANIRWCRLSDAELAQLRRPLWRISPDDSYGDVEIDDELTGIAPVAADPEGLSLCYDPSYTEPVTADVDALRAYQRLGAELDRCAVEVALSPGDLLILDNTVVAHSRAPFTARYDGTDRWLKRVQVHTTRRPLTAAGDPGRGIVRVEPLTRTET